MNASTPIPPCPRCGAPIPPDAPRGLCPRCVLAGVADSTDSGRLPHRRQTPSLDTVRSAFPALEVLELIGSGGMGFVYSARQPQLDRMVALKLLPVAPDSDPAFAERFAREGRLLARLNHPHIVAVYEYGQVPGFCYLILEFVDGVNLRQAMESGRFSPAEALAIVPKICEALQYAHEQGVLHRDIKPENLLLDIRGRVKIADFGIAKMVGDRVTDITLTASGARLGTPHYMAPEQIESPSAVDHRADIYSLGVVFYELLTGELPLGRFGPPSSKASLDARIDDIVMRALAKERELRQQSAGEVKTQVEGLEGGRPVPGTFSGAQDPSTFGGGTSFEYKSRRSIGGLPWLHIVSGIDPKTGRAREARGVLALGPRARGVFAVGGSARGIVAFGGGAMGVVAFGGFAFGGVAIGGFAAGLFSFGGFALALLLAMGGFAVGAEAVGGLAVGLRALGGLVYSGVPGMTSLGWERAVLNWLPWIWVPLSLVILVVTTGSVALTFWAARRQRHVRGTGRPPEVRPNPWPHRLYWLILGSLAVLGSAMIAALGVPMLSRSASGPWGVMNPGWARTLVTLLGLLPMFVGAWVVIRFRQTRPGPERAIPVSQWSPWPKRIFLSIALVVILPLLLIAVGLLVPLLALRRVPPPAPVAPTTNEAMTRPHQTPEDPIPKFFGSLTMEIPMGQTVLETMRHWSNGVWRALPVTNSVFPWVGEPRVHSSGSWKESLNTQLLLPTPGQSNFWLGLISEGDPIAIGFPEGYAPRHSQIELRLDANSVTNVWLFPDARMELPGHQEPQSGIEVVLKTRASVPADRQYRELATSILKLRSQRRQAAGRLEMLQRRISWDKTVTAEEIERASAALNELDLQIHEAVRKLTPLADEVVGKSGTPYSP